MDQHKSSNPSTFGAKGAAPLKIAIEARPIKWSYGTGIGNYTYCLIQKLAEVDRGNDYAFLWPDTGDTAELPFPRSHGIYNLPKDDEREEFEIPLWLAKERVDLFHLPQNGFRIPQAKTCKIVVTIHDLIPYFLPEMVRPSFLKRFTREMPYIVERADQIVTVSEASKRDIISVFGIEPAKITVLPSAPSVAYRPLSPEATGRRLASTYGIKRRFILYVGGLNPRKNVAELIQAYAKINRELRDGQQLLILGPECKHRFRLQLLAEALGLKDRVIFPGFVANGDLPLFYNGADLFVYPSLYEGFGLPPIEAMACGTPVITSNVSSLPEVVGQAALQFAPDDTLQLAESIFRVLDDLTLRRLLITKGLERSANYSWDRIARQMLNLYQTVVNDVSSPTAVGQ